MIASRKDWVLGLAVACTLLAVKVTAADDLSCQGCLDACKARACREACKSGASVKKTGSCAAQGQPRSYPLSCPEDAEHARCASACRAACGEQGCAGGECPLRRNACSRDKCVLGNGVLSDAGLIGFVEMEQRAACSHCASTRACTKCECSKCAGSSCTTSNNGACDHGEQSKSCCNAGCRCVTGGATACGGKCAARCECRMAACEVNDCPEANRCTGKTTCRGGAKESCNDKAAGGAGSDPTARAGADNCELLPGEPAKQIVELMDQLDPGADQSIHCPGLSASDDLDAGDNAAARRAQMVEVLRALDAGQIDEEPMPEMAEEVEGRRLVRREQKEALRYSSSALEHTAAQLEEVGLCDEADCVRRLAGQLREQSRQAAAIRAVYVPSETISE